MTISPKRLQELENIPEDDIDTFDIPELDASFWEKAKLVQPSHKNVLKSLIKGRLVHDKITI